jgi:hypothetical protein
MSTNLQTLSTKGSSNCNDPVEHIESAIEVLLVNQDDMEKDHFETILCKLF